MKITYIFEWTHFDGTEETWRLSDCTRQEALEGACRAGWKPPRWWQWWRWSDGPRAADLLERLSPPQPTTTTEAP